MLAHEIKAATLAELDARHEELHKKLYPMDGNEPPSLSDSFRIEREKTLVYDEIKARIDAEPV